MENIDIDLTKWERVLDALFDSALDIGLRIVLAMIVYIAGRFIISRVIKALIRLKSFRSIDPTAEGYIITFVKATLYVVLVVSIVAILGVPMSSVIAVIASAGIAIGMALQGALGNIAGGLMLLIFRPFVVGDYIRSSTGEQGYVMKISLVYTQLRTFDNRIISVPNGSLMNASIQNMTADERRRVDFSFDISESEPAGRVREIVMGVISKNEMALREPEPLVLPTDYVTDGITYTVRVWVRTEDYWPVYEGLMEAIPEALREAGIRRPATPLKIDGRNS